MTAASESSGNNDGRRMGVAALRNDGHVSRISQNVVLTCLNENGTHTPWREGSRPS